MQKFKLFYPVFILSVIIISGVFASTPNRNPVILQGFYWYIGDPGTKQEEPESNLWQYIIDKKAVELKQDGFTHVWLPPMGKAFSPNKEYNVGYSIYDHYDLGEFNQMGRIRTKYGTKKQLIKAIEALHLNEIKAIADIVMNHMLGTEKNETVKFSKGFEVEKNKNVKNLGNGNITAYVNFDFKNEHDISPRGTKYSDFVWNKTHFDGMEFFDKYFLFAGKQTDKVSYFGDLIKLPATDQEAYKNIRSDIILGADIDFQNQEVQKEIIRWTKWLVKETNVDGFRVDAIRHIDTPFIEKWGKEMHSHMNMIGKGKDLLIFGESWDGWSERLSSYLAGKSSNNDLFYNEGQGPSNYCGIDHSMSLFDVPLHYDFQKVAKQNNSFPPTRMKDLPERGLVSSRKNYAITFVDNHDTVPTQELASYIPVHTKIQAYTFILLNEYGIPTVFYRDIYKGNFVSKYESDNFTFLNSNIRKLVEIRHKYAYGHGTYYRNNSRPGILGYKRDGDQNNHPGSGLIYLIREYNSNDNGLRIPLGNNNKYKLAAGNGNMTSDGWFSLDKNSHFAIWVRR